MGIIRNFKAYPVTGKEGDSFIGLKARGNEIILYYPETYHISDNEENIREDVIDLLKTISIAKTNTDETVKITNSYSRDCDFALLSYLWIINDYMNNGFYINREKVLANNKGGRIDWNKTMQQTPVVSDGNVVYLNIVGELKNPADNIITEIHRYCVKKSIEIIGWLFNLTADYIFTEPYNEAQKKLYIHTISAELDRTFDDLKKTRLTHMLNVIRGLDEESDNQRFVYGVDNYHYVFERMVDSVFGTVQDLRKFNPSAKWHLKIDNGKSIAASKLRPDTVLIKDGHAFVIDSKYYRFGYTGDSSDLPGTTSIQKQITYGDFIEKYNLGDVSNVFNAFILPYDRLNNPFNMNNHLEYLGHAESDWKDNDKNHQIIHTFLIDLKYLIKSWNKSDHDNEINTLIKNILDNKYVIE